MSAEHSSASSSVWEVVGDLQQEAEPEGTPATRRWARLVRLVRRIRFTQRLWGVLGGYLRTAWPDSLRDRLLKHL
jgi:hypothetical protein